MNQSGVEINQLQKPPRKGSDESSNSDEEIFDKSFSTSRNPSIASNSTPLLTKQKSQKYEKRTVLVDLKVYLAFIIAGIIGSFILMKHMIMEGKKFQIDRRLFIIANIVETSFTVFVYLIGFYAGYKRKITMVKVFRIFTLILLIMIIINGALCQHINAENSDDSENQTLRKGEYRGFILLCLSVIEFGYAIALYVQAMWIEQKVEDIQGTSPQE